MSSIVCSHVFKSKKLCSRAATLGAFCNTHSKVRKPRAPRKPKVVTAAEGAPAAPPLGAAAILLFTTSAKGRGRETNDANNKKREQLLGSLLTNTIHDADPVHGVAWRLLRTQWSTALLSLGPSGATSVAVQGKGGRKLNYDFEASYTLPSSPSPVVLKIEFKFGKTTICSHPQFFSPAANKPFHSRLYADFFYDGYLDEVCALYSIAGKPSKDEYLNAIHAESSKLPFFAQLKKAEEDEGIRAGYPGVKLQHVPAEKVPLYTRKAALSHASIQAYLAAYQHTTDLAVLTAEFQRSQAGKRFLLYSGGAFHHDRILPGELVAASVKGVEGDYLVLQTTVPTTTISMLLRWKNHHCVLFPAWQISLCRA